MHNQFRKNLEDIKTAGIRAKDVVAQLLSFSRKTRVHKKTVDLNQIIQETRGLLRATIPSQVDIQCQLSEEPLFILADTSHIQQVILNLSTNAFHAMEKTGGHLTIGSSKKIIRKHQASAVGEPVPGNYVQLTVSDTGKGIPDHIRKKIFEPYFTTKKAGKGSGMGLAMVHGTINSHGGTIQFSSDNRVGTVFKILLPEAETVDSGFSERDFIEPPAESDRLKDRSAVTILFVDDEPMLCDIGQRLIETLG